MKFLFMTNRELKRVPLDFNWPINEVWYGYLIKHRKNPPKGDGYQCWETTSEGSPISPVFDSIEKLCDWLPKNTKGITKNFSKEDWLETLKGNSIVVDMETNKPFKEA